MAVPYSLDLRKRVVTAVTAGMSRAQAAAHYQVSHSSAIRWTRRLAETGSPAALPMGARPRIGVIFVLVQVSSTNTRRFGSMWPCRAFHC